MRSKLIFTSLFLTALVPIICEQPQKNVNIQKLYDEPTHVIAHLNEMSDRIHIITTDGLEWSVESGQSSAIAKEQWTPQDQLVLYRSFSLFKYYWFYNPRTNRWVFVSPPIQKNNDQVAFKLSVINQQRDIIEVENARGDKLHFKTMHKDDDEVIALEKWEVGDIVTFGSRRSLSLGSSENHPIFILNVSKKCHESFSCAKEELDAFESFKTL
ncbi:MAG: hypothetical protein K9M07_03160 [Simkaniaceae bacterium]|nr:hypothetical protein [Simkaniaceae bacterium]MCF7852222.1 hypothetical protein [Simkaniaceae bacterium]